MYCRKCGKQIDYDAEFCKDCQEMESFFAEPKEYSPQWQTMAQAPVQPALEGNKKEGFGKALTSTILGGIAYFIIMIAYGIILAAAEEISDGGYNYYETHEELMFAVGVAVVFMLISLAVAIPSLILGIKSIKCFFRQKRAGKVKPVPTLVLGIVGTVMSSMVLLFSLLIFLLAMTV